MCFWFCPFFLFKSCCKFQGCLTSLLFILQQLRLGKSSQFNFENNAISAFINQIFAEEISSECSISWFRISATTSISYKNFLVVFYCSSNSMVLVSETRSLHSCKHNIIASVPVLSSTLPFINHCSWTHRRFLPAIKKWKRAEKCFHVRGQNWNAETTKMHQKSSTSRYIPREELLLHWRSKRKLLFVKHKNIGKCHDDHTEQSTQLNLSLSQKHLTVQ